MVNKRAFTLVEVVLVIFIIGLISVLMYIGYSAVQKNAAVTRLQSDLSNAYEQLDIFQYQNGNYPTTNNCAVSDSATNLCLKTSKNVTLSYQFNNNISPKRYCLTATDGSYYYYTKGSSSTSGASTTGEGACNACGAVTSGMILCLDASDSTSYPGSGLTWYDISGNGNNATLVNGPSFNAAYNGSFLLDNVDDEISLSGINWESLGASKNFSFIFGAKKTEYGTGGNNVGDSYLMFGSASGYTEGWRITENSRSTPGTIFTGPQNYCMGIPWSTYGGCVADSVSNRFSISAFSVNGTSLYGFNNNNTISTTTGAYIAGTSQGIMGRQTYGVGRFTGYIGFAVAYNRALTTSEITAIYRSIKSKYGL